jgi:hypothetical protein
MPNEEWFKTVNTFVLSHRDFDSPTSIPSTSLSANRKVLGVKNRPLVTSNPPRLINSNFLDYQIITSRRALEKRNRFTFATQLRERTNYITVRPGRLRNTVSTPEYLIAEMDRLVTSVLDAVEIVSAHSTEARTATISS